MASVLAIAAIAATSAAVANAATAQTFAPPAPCPVCTSDNYVGANNGSLTAQSVVSGLVYDRFIQVWLENTDFASAAADSNFQALAEKGILLTQYNGVTHPSEPNYVAAVAGDFFGMPDDSNYWLPDNVTNIVDLLEAKDISWASYQENSPTDAYPYDFAQTNYLNTSAGSYTYYKRKHNPHQIMNNIAGNSSRAKYIRNFNDFAVDVNASVIPQYVWVTPNLVNDAHDTDPTFVGEWLNWWLQPLLNNTAFNDNKTLILLTFDENESYDIQNNVFTLLLGGAVPDDLRGTNDTSYYTHYSALSSLQNNWGLDSLGRQDTNATVARVWNFQANATNYTNYEPTDAEIPLTNLTGIFSGPCNTEQWVPVWAPNVTAVGAGGGSVMYNSSITNTASTFDTLTAVNLTALSITNPIMIDPEFDTVAGFSNVSTATTTTSGATGSATASTTGAAATSSAASSAEKQVAVGSALVGAVLVAFSTLF